MRMLGSGICGEGGASIEQSLFPIDGELMWVTSPSALDEADDLVIDEDAFHFSASIFQEIGDPVEWESSLPFSEIAELRFEPSSGIVSGTLKDGSELNFEIMTIGGPEIEAMQAVAALFAPEISVPTPDESALGDRESSERLQALEIAFAATDLDGCEAQMRRFAHITSAAGLDVDRPQGKFGLSAMWPGTSEVVVDFSWNSRSRVNWRVHSTGAFGEDRSEAKKALPKIGFLRFADVAKTDQFLDALEAFLITHRLREPPDHLRSVKGAGDRTRVSRHQRPAPGSPVLSDEDYAAAIQSLQGAFDDAAECGAEPQVRRFAELNVFVGLHVKWVKKRRRLEASEGEMTKSVFTLRWKPEGGFEVVLGFAASYGGDGGSSSTESLACYPFDVEDWEVWRALPVAGWKSSMDAQQTDRFLDALEVFFASHSLPYKSD